MKISEAIQVCNNNVNLLSNMLCGEDLRGPPIEPLELMYKHNELLRSDLQTLLRQIGDADLVAVEN